MKLYGAVINAEIVLGTVRKYKKEAEIALCHKKSWSNCMDMHFSPTMEELRKEGWEIKELELTIKDTNNDK
jgi:hypothetical protein